MGLGGSGTAITGIKVTAYQIPIRDAAAARFTPAMRQKIDMEKIYRRALRALPETIDRANPFPLPATCPVTLAVMLAD